MFPRCLPCLSRRRTSQPSVVSQCGQVFRSRKYSFPDPCLLDFFLFSYVLSPLKILYFFNTLYKFQTVKSGDKVNILYRPIVPSPLSGGSASQRRSRHSDRPPAGLYLGDTHYVCVYIIISVQPKGSSSTENSVTKVAVLLGINRCGSFPLFSAIYIYIYIYIIRVFCPMAGP